MKPYQAIGWSMIQTTAITSYTTTGRISHGLRSVGTTTPCINYYEMPGVGRFNGVESVTYSINCRATNPATARDMARKVVTLFTGSSGTGVYGTQNGFDIARASLRQDNGLIPEPEDGIYNASVDVTIVYAVDTIS